MVIQATMTILLSIVPLLLMGQSQSIKENMIEKIFEYGALAPSSHNAQMWYISKEKEGLYKVGIDPQWRLQVVDPHDREAYISIGAFIQNCVLAAPLHGLSIDITIKDTVVYLNFLDYIREKREYEYNLMEIKNRHTCRMRFQNKQISSDVLKNISSSFGNLEYIDCQSVVGRELIDMIVRSNIAQLSSKNSMEELTDFIVLKKNDKRRGRGLTLESLGLNQIERFFFRIIYAKKNFINNKSFISSSIQSTKNQLNNCSGFFMLYTKNDTPEDLIRLGMKLESLWIKLNSMGISVHPMSQPLEEMPDSIANLFPGAGTPEMILRVGYCNHKHPRRKLRKKMTIWKNQNQE